MGLAAATGSYLAALAVAIAAAGVVLVRSERAHEVSASTEPLS